MFYKDWAFGRWRPIILAKFTPNNLESLGEVLTFSCMPFLWKVSIYLTSMGHCWHSMAWQGLKWLEPIAFVKDCKGPEKEKENPVQICLPEFVSEDPQFFKCDMPPLSEKFPEEASENLTGWYLIPGLPCTSQPDPVLGWIQKPPGTICLLSVSMATVHHALEQAGLNVKQVQKMPLPHLCWMRELLWQMLFKGHLHRNSASNFCEMMWFVFLLFGYVTQAFFFDLCGVFSQYFTVPHLFLQKSSHSSGIPAEFCWNKTGIRQNKL